MNIAKKLKNVVIFEEDDKEFNEFMKGIKKSELKIVPIQVVILSSFNLLAILIINGIQKALMMLFFVEKTKYMV